MENTVIFLCASFIAGLILFSSQNPKSTIPKRVEKFTYPEVRRDESVFDDYYGTKIADPYRWLESPNSPETKIFIEKQNNLTNEYTRDVNVRDAMRRKLETVWNYEKVQCPVIAKGKYYYSKNTGLQNQDVFYVQENLNGDPKVFIDPSVFSEDGTAAISKTDFSKDGTLLAYGINKRGSDWATVHFKNTISGEDLPDKLEFMKFYHLVWDENNSGVYYDRYDKPSKNADGSENEISENHKLYYHKLGTPESEDVLLLEFPDKPQWFITFQLAENQKHIMIVPDFGIGHMFMYHAKLEKDSNTGYPKNLDVFPIIEDGNNHFANLGDADGHTYYFTDRDAPNGRIIAINWEHPEEKYWKVILPEDKKYTLFFPIGIVNRNYLLVTYIRDVIEHMELRHTSNGSFIQTIGENEIGSKQVCWGRNTNDSDLFYTFQSFLAPSTIYHMSFKNEEISQPKIWKEATIKGFNPNDYQTMQVFYTSYDGTKVPMFITHKKNLTLTGQLPTKLYAYGGFATPLYPFYSPEDIIFIQNFVGVYAIANIRGGGEYGSRWWNGGRLLNKQNSFNDFQAAAEYLISANYTNPSKLYIQGTSNGGLLVAACVNQRPELYGTVIVRVGVLDMLRFQKFSVGYSWCTEYGCSDEKIHFENLLKYSPLHNIQLPSNESIQYPSVLVTTADHDDRVVPLHSYKYIAELQHTIGRSERQKNPLMIRIESDAGHGHGVSVFKKIDESVDIYSFVMKSLDYKFYY